MLLDHLSSFWFCPSPLQVELLVKEGIQGPNVVITGNTGNDATLLHARAAVEHSAIHERLGLVRFFTSTIENYLPNRHRETRPLLTPRRWAMAFPDSPSAHVRMISARTQASCASLRCLTRRRSSAFSASDATFACDGRSLPSFSAAATTLHISMRIVTSYPLRC